MTVYPRLAVFIMTGCLAAAGVAPVIAANRPGDQDQRAEPLLYFEAESLNEGLPPLENPPDLSTPRAALMSFIVAAREGKFSRAARSLNFQHIPDGHLSVYSSLAMQLYYVMTQRIAVDFKTVPDRQDGSLEGAPDRPDSRSEPGGPRRSLKIGEVPLALGDAEIRLERVKPRTGEPVWLFSPRTVEKIPELYERHGPGPFFDRLPFPVRQGLLSGSTAWQWTILLAVGALAGLSGWLVHKFARMVSRRLASNVVKEEAARLAAPFGMLIALVGFYVVIYVLLAPPGDDVRGFYILISMLILAGLTWAGIRVIDVVSAFAARRCRVEVGTYAEEEARVRYTRISVGRHVLIFLAICVGLGLALYQLQLIKNLSLSFLASAGVAGVLLGATAHTVLGNTLAGIQIAMTRPVAIGDSVNFEGQWGFVEDMTYAYISIRTWDGRRVIVPVSYFISHPFENWSKSDTRMMRPIFLYADYHVDVEAIRQEFRRRLEESELWDRTVEPILQVTGMSEKTIELRALCSAKDPGTAWNLHCAVRESLVTFLQQMEGGRYLPKHRVELSDHVVAAGHVDARGDPSASAGPATHRVTGRTGTSG